jgi:predicted transcriptional regulator
MFNYLIEEYDVSYLIDLLQQQGIETADRIANSLISQTKSWNRWEESQGNYQKQEVFTGI